MHVIFIDAETIAAGREAVSLYADGLLCGPGSDAYAQAMGRATGPDLLAGAFQACIERGIRNEIDLVAAASRATGVRRQMGVRALRALSVGSGRLFVPDRDGLYGTRAEYEAFLNDLVD